MNKRDEDKILYDYNKRYEKYGYDPKTLGWDKGKQDLRFNILTSQYDFNGKKILDIGCGFGDLKIFLDKHYNGFDYTGIDLVETLIRDGKKRVGKATFHVCNYLEYQTDEKFDFALSSGMFNRKFGDRGDNNEQFIYDCMKKTYSLCRDGFAFDFLSDKVDYQYEHTYHSKPERILEMAYTFSRRVILRNDYMPFEFSIFVFHDDSFDERDTVFHAYKTKMDMDM